MKRHVDRILLVISILSMVTNVVLLYRLHFSAHRPFPRPSLLGHYVTTIDVLRIDNTWAKLDLRNAGKPTVLYIFRAGCRFCEENQSDLDKLTTSVGNKFRFVGLATTGTGLKTYISTHPMNFPVYVSSMEFVKSLNLGSTPQTLVVDESGQIIKDWSGIFVGPSVREIQEYFGVSLH